MDTLLDSSEVNHNLSLNTAAWLQFNEILPKAPCLLILDMIDTDISVTVTVTTALSALSNEQSP